MNDITEGLKYAVKIPLTYFSVTSCFKIAIIACLSGFVIATAYSFLHFRLRKKEHEYAKLLNILGASENNSQFSPRTVSQEYSVDDYWLPVAFNTFVCILGFYSLLFGSYMISSHYGKPNMLLTGMSWGDPDMMQKLRWQNQLVLSFAFIGAFLWSAQNIIRRLLAGDLTPNTYYSSALRMLFASVLSLMLSFFLETLPSAESTRESLPFIAFISGMLPENTLAILKERVNSILRTGGKTSHDLPLEMIEGINIFHKLRLSEEGIDNAQNLAEANLIDLVLKTPFNPNQLIDWIAQARLYIYFKDDISNLRALGVRTAFDLNDLSTDPSRLTQLAEEAAISNTRLSIVCDRLVEDESLARLSQFHKKLNANEQVQQLS